MKLVSKLLVLIWLAICCGCGLTLKLKSRPDLFVNEKFNQTSESERGLDVLTCLDTADAHVKVPNKYWQVGKNAFYGALIGTAPGAVSGAILGDTPQNTAVGAAVGTVVGLLQGIQKLYDDDPFYQRFVEHCLHKKGYEIVGWVSR